MINCKAIDESLFSGCISLTEVAIKNCNKIGPAAFYSCVNLKEVTTVVYEDNKFSLKPLQVYNFKYSKSYNVKVKNKIIKCNVYSLSRKDYFNNR